MSESRVPCGDAATVRDVLCRKAVRGVLATGPDASVRDVADRMICEGVGSLLVMEGPRLVGIVTERELVRMVRAGPFSDQVRARDIMNPDVLCCGDEATADEVAELMRARRGRHVAVVDANEDIVGVVSLGDINAHRVGQCQTALGQLEHYVYRRA